MTLQGVYAFLSKAELRYRGTGSTMTGYFGAAIHGELPCNEDNDWWDKNFTWSKTSIYTLIEALKLRGLV